MHLGCVDQLPRFAEPCDVGGEQRDRDLVHRCKVVHLSSVRGNVDKFDNRPGSLIDGFSHDDF